MYNNQSSGVNEQLIFDDTSNQSHFGALDLDSESETLHAPKDPLIPDEKFIYNFRPEWEDFFREIDDKLIKIAQRFHLKRKDDDSKANKIWGRVMQMFAWFVTFFARIENLSSVCLFVLALGYDYIGSYLTIVGIISGLAAQVPKRFLFRKRPYMVGRALPSGKLDTSSFPSRAVTCSVVYSFSAIVCYNYQTGVMNHDPNATLGYFLSAILVLLAFLSSSFARIHLGAHFPSDCLGGLILGLFISFTSWGLFQLPNVFGCPNCYADQCYVGQTMDDKNFSLQNLGLSITVMGITGIFLVMSSCPPLVFWNKSAPIFGTICACVVAELLMVCPGKGTIGLKTPVRSYNFVSILLAGFVAGFQLGVAFFASKAHKITRKLPLIISSLSNLIIYLFFSLGLLFVLVKVRLAVIGQSSK